VTQAGAFRRVLVANRGEIAVRITRSLRAMGIAAAVVHHAEEAASLAVREADEAYEVTGETPVAAYLDAEQIVGIARRIGAEAIHPGFGFLSENAAFAEAVRAAGLAFIGPSSAAIRLMGDKVGSREFVRKHGFAVAPSAYDEDDPATFVERAAAIGFPLLVKASAGGGGKGMHIVREPAELGERIDAARREATRYFGDGRVYCERYVERPRHIEVQVLGDEHGNLVHLWERECSIQRRFQKIVEEAPAPGLDDALRRRLLEAATGIARAAGYSNAGTIEFILAPDGRFYFLEMNTRLQVEHPVTEMITGLDLVALQVRVAQGERLPIAQDDVQCVGHSIECRICAEDAEADFMPATGAVLALRAPAGPGVRFDSGLVAGQKVTAAYDPMLAKLIVHGIDRAQAIARMRAGLRELVLLGVTTNAAYLERLLGHAEFAAGRLHTGFVAEHPEALRSPAPDETTLQLVLAAATLTGRTVRDLTRHVPEPYASIGAWRN
jgi:propionyl-CoA carboxylase alpha chain/3-methylcrotonyl-CoA carboxylase alpha subunit/acetyl-CoA/propionyl-CoA carboxylase biotin carboxyl carrier protein